MNRANDKGERSMVFSKMRLWRYNIAFKTEEVKKIEDQCKGAYTAVKVDATCLNFIPDADKTKKYVEELPIGEDDIVFVELPKSADKYVIQPINAPRE